MRCQDCNRNLSDEESTRKDPRTGEYIDVCNQCLSNLYEDLGGDFDLPFDGDLDSVLDESGEDEEY